MNDIHQTNNHNAQPVGEKESVDIDLTTAGDHLPQTEHENARENIQQDLTANQNIAVSEEKNILSVNTEQMTDFSLSSINQNKDNIGQIKVGNNEYINTNSDLQIVKNVQNDIDSTHIVQSVGHILRKARAAKGMSIEDVSRQLRLSVQQIEVIEKEDFDKLPGRTFLRGFIRNYANLVQLDPVPLLQMLPESARTMSTYERMPLKKKQISFSSSRESSGSNRLVIFIVLFASIFGAYFIFENNNWNNKSDSNLLSSETKRNTEKTSMEIQLPLSATVKNTANPQAHKTSETNVQVNDEKNSEMRSNIKTETFTIPIPIENKPVTQEETEKPAAASGDLGNLYFKFTADSWVKVVDGKGVLLLEQLKKKGSEQSVAGKKPLSIVIGNASGVNLTYNDTEIDISSYKKQDGTARFTLQ
ncbi:RodZ domain-containing protein [Nitrosomonas sp. Nm166]|uniref:RodZ domain-containing protein n=1 Tax=Nitrosomonas sp. Nm166 TaxID=1881054 RepID=UPI0008E0A1C6|nr:RodZ domain-containing protein [Nitrosomonas sp. Nm166]SFE52659.1 cytoskeleton protein RodZ [Nitrosomonas sp. Nm166]